MNGYHFEVTAPGEAAPPGKLANVALCFDYSEAMLQTLHAIVSWLRSDTDADPITNTWTADCVEDLIRAARLMDGIKIIEFGVWAKAGAPHERYVTMPSRVTVRDTKQYRPLIIGTHPNALGPMRLKVAVIDAYEAWARQPQATAARAQGAAETR